MAKGAARYLWGGLAVVGIAVGAYNVKEQHTTSEIVQGRPIEPASWIGHLVVNQPEAVASMFMLDSENSRDARETAIANVGMSELVIALSVKTLVDMSKGGGK